MARVFGVELGATRTIDNLRVNNTKTATIAVGAGVTRLAWSFDMARFTDPADELRMIVDISVDGGTVWRESSISTFPGGAASSKTGEPPSGVIPLPAGVTHVRVTFVPMAGQPVIGVWAAAA